MTKSTHDKLKLAPTAALVMELAKDLYQTGPIAQYYKCLDFSSSDVMMEQFKTKGMYDHELVLLSSRKYLIKQLILDEIKSTETNFPNQKYQIVTLASGLSPLSIEILLENPKNLETIYEVDISDLSEKQALFQELYPDLSHKIKFLEEDVTSTSLIDKLGQHGYRADLKTILIVEGITHFISKEETQKILGRFKSENKTNFVLLEYSLDDKVIDPELLGMIREIYQIIADDCDTGFTKYNHNDLHTIFNELKGQLTKIYSSFDMERAKTSTNKFFKKPNSGWLECVTGNL